MEPELTASKTFDSPPLNEGFSIMNMLCKIFAALALAAMYVNAEKHTVSFQNK